jgi:hypothetical protein
MEGSSDPEEKPLGPVQKYVAPAMVFELRLRVAPTHIGLLDEMVGVGVVTTSI